VLDTLECNGILDRKERQVLRVFEEKCCWKKELKKTSTYGILLSTTELLLRRIRPHFLQRRGGMRLVGTRDLDCVPTSDIEVVLYIELGHDLVLY
jgi:hypothetical protein